MAAARFIRRLTYTVRDQWGGFRCPWLDSAEPSNGVLLMEVSVSSLKTWSIGYRRERRTVERSGADSGLSRIAMIGP